MGYQLRQDLINSVKSKFLDNGFRSTYATDYNNTAAIKEHIVLLTEMLCSLILL